MTSDADYTDKHTQVQPAPDHSRAEFIVRAATGPALAGPVFRLGVIRSA
jgi:hypothetical protein